MACGAKPRVKKKAMMSGPVVECLAEYLQHLERQYNSSR